MLEAMLTSGERPAQPVPLGSHMCPQPPAKRAVLASVPLWEPVLEMGPEVTAATAAAKLQRTLSQNLPGFTVAQP